MKIKLVVGLGNPGKKYNNTHHNIGFMVLDNLAEKMEVYKWKERDGALYFDCFWDMCRVIFIKPQRFINLSGDVMINFVNFLDIKTEDILIISDDLDLPLGTIRLKERGSSGGHNGLKNIEQQLKTQEYKRIKVGISSDIKVDAKDYVLSKLTPKEQRKLKPVIETVANIVLESVRTPFGELMNKYNGKQNKL